MSVRVVPYEGGRWEVDVRVRLTSGKNHREKKVLAGMSRTNAKRWAEARERHLLLNGPDVKKEEVPTLKEFHERFLNEYARANRQKPSGVSQKEIALRVHLVPALGDKRLNEIATADVQRLKVRLEGKSSKTVNNVLTVLSKLLKVAVEWGVLEQVPCSVKLMRPGESAIQFWNFEQYGRLVNAAREIDARVHLAVLLGGDAGLRKGEMQALQWSDINISAGKMTVARSDWRGIVGTTKGNRVRTVPLTSPLLEALQRHRSLKSPLVLCKDDGTPFTANGVSYLIEQATRRAGLTTVRKQKDAGPHVLRHTFCSHHAMSGTPPRVLQEIAGHRSLTTTMRYMHLVPGATDSATRQLERHREASMRGAEGEAAMTGA